ncbi:hypothetical protein [Umezawaea tangerina]|nr:hypothetical protein [Umezawaea tangerina]
MSDAQARNLINAVNNVSNAQVELNRQQLVLQGSITQVAATQDQTRSELQDLSARFEEYTRRDELRHNLQIASTGIIEVRQELTTNFGQFSDVRRLATGTLQALDVGIVSHGTMRQLSEELMLLTPNYWLAPALVAIAAWIRDDEALAGKALGEAVRRDNDKASLFFALVLRRHQRNEATARWLRQYTARQDPSKLSREFTVVLDAVSTGAFGHEAKPLVLEQMSEWYDRLCSDQGIVDKQVGRWAEMLDTLRRPVDPRYTVLPSISPTWPRLKELYEGATVHGAAEAMFRQMFSGPVPQSDDLHKRVDDILAKLVTNFDLEEAPLRRKEATLQAIIDADGDKVAAATAMRVADPLHEATVDFLTLISNAALHAEKAGASLGTRRFAVALARDWIVQAAGRLEAGNLATVPSEVEVTLEGWRGTIDGATGEQHLVAGLARHIDRQTDRAVAKVRFTGGPLAAAIGAGFALLFALLSAFGGSVGFAVFMILVAGGLGGWAAVQARGLPARRAEIRRQGEQRKAVALARLRGGIAELVDLRAEWEQELAAAQGFRQYVEGLNSTAFAALAPDQKRGA